MLTSKLLLRLKSAYSLSLDCGPRVRSGQTLPTMRLLPPAGPSVLIVPFERGRKCTSSGMPPDEVHCKISLQRQGCVSSVEYMLLTNSYIIPPASKSSDGFKADRTVLKPADPLKLTSERRRL